MPITIATPGMKQGGSDALEMFLKTFAGEILTAYSRMTATLNRHQTRTISHGKSAAFPVTGRATALYLTPGNSLDAQLQKIAGTEKTINIDGLLTAATLITDLDDAMNHFDVSVEYSRQLGEALAIAADGATIAEIAKLVIADAENLTGLGKGAIINKTVATGTALTSATLGQYYLDMLLEMKYNLDSNYVPQTERVAYIKPDVTAALVNAKVVINADYGGSSNIQEAQPIRVAGFDLVTVPHLTTGGADNANVIQGSGHVFPATYAAKTKIVAAHRGAVGMLKLKDLAMEHARRPEYQGDMIIAKMAVGHGGLRPEAVQLGTVEFA
ncbi:hypothetical protein SPFL3102_03579 [Sporomusaceae bacterium FL31]|nr:hypothetical protein SPFL3101_00426 [Sporomusaceae bacterium FL31]GCE35728.1 hypothetical protein SPFL3102_03579 [Sporomusaceae bacterium]